MQTLLQLVTATAVQAVPAAQGAGVTLVDEQGHRSSSAGTDEQVLRWDRLQYELDEGPCLTAHEQRRAVLVADVATDDRWPRWGAAVHGAVGSTLSVPLVAGDRGLGAIKLYGREPEAFGDRDVDTLRLFAGQAALLVQHREDRHQAGRLSDDLQTLLRRRDTLARACGVLMGRERLSADAAFTYLVSLAEQQRRPVHEVAARLLAGYDSQERS